MLSAHRTEMLNGDQSVRVRLTEVKHWPQLGLQLRAGHHGLSLLGVLELLHLGQEGFLPHHIRSFGGAPLSGVRNIDIKNALVVESGM